MDNLLYIKSESRQLKAKQRESAGLALGTTPLRPLLPNRASGGTAGQMCCCSTRFANRIQHRETPRSGDVPNRPVGPSAHDRPCPGRFTGLRWCETCSYLCRKTPTFGFRQEVKFAIDWARRYLFIITVISQLISGEVTSFTKILQAPSFTSQLHIWAKRSITAAHSPTRDVGKTVRSCAKPGGRGWAPTRARAERPNLWAPGPLGTQAHRSRGRVFLVSTGLVPVYKLSWA